MTPLAVCWLPLLVLLNHGELSDSDSGIDHDFGWPCADDRCPGEVRASLPVVACVCGQEDLAQADVADDLYGQTLRDEHLQVTQSHGYREPGPAETFAGQAAQVENCVTRAQVVVGAAGHRCGCPRRVPDPSAGLDPGGHRA